VLAASAIENARLLLASCHGNVTLGNQHGWVGRCFMEHPRDYALDWLPGRRTSFVRSRSTISAVVGPTAHMIPRRRTVGPEAVSPRTGSTREPTPRPKNKASA
jgi:hypothetical protein